MKGLHLLLLFIKCMKNIHFEYIVPDIRERCYETKIAIAVALNEMLAYFKYHRLSFI